MPTALYVFLINKTDNIHAIGICNKDTVEIIYMYIDDDAPTSN